METANKERKALEKIILTTAVKQISNYESKRPYIIVQGKGWHKGVIGIIASRLKDLYAGLCVAITIDGNVAHGSIRSTEQIDLTKILHELKYRDVLISGGGHKQAAGFSYSWINLMNLIKLWQTMYLTKHHLKTLALYWK